MGTEEAAALISGVMATCFTPSSIFIVLNLVIGTIFIRSRFGAPIVQVAVTVATAPIKQIPHHLPKLLRAPILLHRITPFNSQPTQTETQVEIPCPNPEKPQEQRLASLSQRLQYSIEVSSLKRSESLDGDQKEAELEGSDSETEGERQLREEEEDEEAERRQLREDQAEDAKADDFISSFKKDLRMQRVNSYLDYEQMLEGN